MLAGLDVLTLSASLEGCGVVWRCPRRTGCPRIHRTVLVLCNQNWAASPTQPVLGLSGVSVCLEGVRGSASAQSPGVCRLLVTQLLVSERLGDLQGCCLSPSWPRRAGGRAGSFHRCQGLLGEMCSCPKSVSEHFCENRAIN